jgi:hypothetical protein
MPRQWIRDDDLRYAIAVCACSPIDLGACHALAPLGLVRHGNELRTCKVFRKVADLKPRHKHRAPLVLIESKR